MAYQGEILPKNWQLEPLLEDTQDLLIILLNERYLRNNGRFSDPETVLESKKSLQLITILTHNICGNEVTAQSSDACIEGFYFAHTASELLLPHSPTLATRPVIEALCDYSGDAGPESIHKLTKDYSDNHPTIGGLVEAHLFEMTPDEKYHHAAEQIALLTFMFIEAGQRKLYIDTQCSQFALELSGGQI